MKFSERILARPFRAKEASREVSVAERRIHRRTTRNVRVQAEAEPEGYRVHLDSFARTW